MCLTFNLFVRQCENGVMKRNIVACYGQIKFSEVSKLTIREITKVRHETEIDRVRLCRRDQDARTKSKNTTKKKKTTASQSFTSFVVIGPSTVKSAMLIPN